MNIKAVVLQPGSSPYGHNALVNEHCPSGTTGTQLSRDLLFQTGEGGNIPLKYRLDAHAFCGGQMKMLQVILGLTLIRSSDGCSTTVISFPR